MAYMELILFELLVSGTWLDKIPSLPRHGNENVGDETAGLDRLLSSPDPQSQSKGSH